MKKILVSLLASAALLTSCDMDTPQKGVIDDETAIESAENARYFRNYFYSLMRGMTTGGFVYTTEIQCDQFVSLASSGGRGGALAMGNQTSSTSEIESVYSGCYGAIANVNYFIDKAQALIEGGTLSTEEVQDVERYIGEAKFLRAYAYFFLFDRYCLTYDESKGDTPALGLQITTGYYPTYDSSTYPGRSTMNETLQLINDDLTDAYNALKAYENLGYVENLEAGAPYLSTMAVRALQARIALVTGKYQTAKDYANEVIASNLYTLARGADFAKIWNETNVSEFIFQPFVNQSESGSISSICQGWNYWWSSSTQCDIIPGEEALQLYAVNGRPLASDYRFSAYFKLMNMNGSNGKISAYAFNKWPGDASLSPSTNMYLNKPKPFRIAEQYLIVAEASAMLGQTQDALKAVNDLRRARTRTFTEITGLTGNDLIQFVRDERSRELIGEGFRLSDLRRWKVAWTRKIPYTIRPGVDEAFNITAYNVSYSADDYRYVWPIPSSEMNVCPALKGQQNTGY